MKRLLVALLVIGLAGCAPLTRRTAAPGESEAFSTGGYSVEVCDAAYAGRAAACTLTGQGTRQVLRGKETVQAAVTSEPKKAAHKAKAKAHKAKASQHDAKAKAAGEQIGK
jgi:hypothetical protein